MFNTCRENRIEKRVASNSEGHKNHGIEKKENGPIDKFTSCRYYCQYQHLDRTGKYYF